MKPQSFVARIAAVILLIGVYVVSANSQPPMVLAFDPPLPFKSGITATTIYFPLILRDFFARDFIELVAPDDLAVVAEPYTSTIKVISYDPSVAAVTGFRLTEIGAPVGVAPDISTDGTITWLPAHVDIGVHHLIVTAVLSDHFHIGQSDYHRGCAAYAADSR